MGLVPNDADKDVRAARKQLLSDILFTVGCFVVVMVVWTLATLVFAKGGAEAGPHSSTLIHWANSVWIWIALTSSLLASSLLFLLLLSARRRPTEDEFDERPVWERATPR